jgi:hypothetical protein
MDPLNRAALRWGTGTVVACLIAAGAVVVTKLLATRLRIAWLRDIRADLMMLAYVIIMGLAIRAWVALRRGKGNS